MTREAQREMGNCVSDYCQVHPIEFSFVIASVTCGYLLHFAYIFWSRFFLLDTFCFLTGLGI